MRHSNYMRYALFILTVALGWSTMAQTWPQRETVLKVSSVQFLIIVNVERGVNVSKVEIWAVPADTASDEYMLGTATSFKWQGTWMFGQPQTWVFPIPSKPLSITHVFAKAFDMQGKLLATRFLPQHGASALPDALWGAKPEPK